MFRGLNEIVDGGKKKTNPQHCFAHTGYNTC